MTDIALAPPTERVSSVHLVDAVSSSLSGDGKSVGIVFVVVDDAGNERKFMLTYGVERARWLSNLIHEMAKQAEKRTLDQQTLLLHFPLGFSIGGSPDVDNKSFRVQNMVEIPVGGKTIITFDQGMETEYHAVLLNTAAVALAEALRQYAAPRLTNEERQQLKMIKPGAQKLIIPGG